MIRDIGDDGDEERGRKASISRFAHEHIVLWISMKKYGNASHVDLPLSACDILVVFKNKDGKEDFIRRQVKTTKRTFFIEVNLARETVEVI